MPKPFLLHVLFGAVYVWEVLFAIRPLHTLLFSAFCFMITVYVFLCVRVCVSERFACSLGAFHASNAMGEAVWCVCVRGVRAFS